MHSKPYFSVEEIQRKLERFCVYQDRCHQEVEKKMQSFSLIPEAKEQILLHLLSHNFLNEERFAKSFARGKFSVKKWGKQRIIRELKQRAITEYIIKVALKEIDASAYLQTLYQLAEKKNGLIQEPNVFKRRKKLYDFLYRKGFEYDLITQVIAEVISQTNEEE